MVQSIFDSGATIMTASRAFGQPWKGPAFAWQVAKLHFVSD
jgi:hypothetical protein